MFLNEPESTTEAAERDHMVTYDSLDQQAAPPPRRVTSAPAQATSAVRRVRWWILASVSALLLLVLTASGIYLFTRKPPLVEQVVILTVPSGANIKLNDQEYGRSPVKLEQLPRGVYTIEITKEGFEPIIQQIEVLDSEPHEFTLRSAESAANTGLTVEQLKGLAEEAFSMGHYVLPLGRSVLDYVGEIEQKEAGNAFASEMRERVRVAMHEAGRAAIARGDLAAAKEIYNALLEYYAEDADAKAGLARVDSLLAARKGDVGKLVDKAEEALRAGRLIEPARNSALYFARQVRVIDPQNARAQAVLGQVKEHLTGAVEQSLARGDLDAAARQLDQLERSFGQNSGLRDQLRSAIAKRHREEALNNDPQHRAREGLNKYSRGEYAAAIRDLQFAVDNDQATAPVILALGRSYMRIGELDRARFYLLKIPQWADESYRSARGTLGEIAEARGNMAQANDYYTEARRLGGSTIYTIAELDHRIERIARKERERVAEPLPVSIQARHQHGGFLKRTCQGTLSVTSRGVRFEGSEHSFSYSLMKVGLRVAGDEITLDGKDKFKANRGDATRFSDALTRFQNAARD